jgi:hypothetical protein
MACFTNRRPNNRRPFVHYAHVSSTVARLRAELNQIGLENRFYFRNKSHTDSEMLDRQRPGDRVQERGRVLRI